MFCHFGQCSVNSAGPWCRKTVGRIWLRTKKWILINDRSPSIGLEKSSCLLFIHAFNGCDVVSAYHGNGEKTAWHTWNAWPEASTVFRKLSQYPPVLGEDDQSILEKFVVIMYDISSATENTSYDSPPSPSTTQAALIQHIKRAAYQAICIWEQETTICQMETKSPVYWGWKKQDDMWQMFWTVLPPIAQSCQQLTKSGCKTEFRGRCKCYCFSLPCIALCSCNCGGYNLFMIFA
jgi:hypothetical protein